MTRLTHDPVPPFVAREICLGHAFDYATCWEVVDANDAYPLADAIERDAETLMDREWCEREAERLNAKYASCDTHPKGGDAEQAPSVMSGAVPSEAQADAQPSARSQHD